MMLVDKEYVEALKKEIEEDFLIRAKQKRTHYSFEEVIYIVWKCIDDFEWQRQRDIKTEEN